MWGKNPDDPTDILHHDCYSAEKQDYPKFFKLSLGNYWDNCGDRTFQFHMIEIYVNEDMTIRNVVSRGCYTCKHDCFSCKSTDVKKVGRLIKKLRVGDKLVISNKKIQDWLDDFIKEDPRFKFNTALEYKLEVDSDFELIRKWLEDAKIDYKKKHPLFEVHLDLDWLKEHKCQWTIEKYWDYNEADARTDGIIRDWGIPEDKIKIVCNDKW